MTKLESHDLQYAPAPIVQNALPGSPGKSWAEVLYSQRCMAMFRAGIISALFPEQEASSRITRPFAQDHALGHAGLEPRASDHKHYLLWDKGCSWSFLALMALSLEVPRPTLRPWASFRKALK